MIKVGTATKWLGKAAFPAVTAVLGFMAHDFVDFRNKQIDATRVAIEQSRTANDAIHNFLSKYANIALKGGAISDADRTAFSEALNKAYSQAHRVSLRVPAIESTLSEYDAALVALKQASDELKGPASGRAFVEATSRYLAAEAAMEKASERHQQNYLTLYVMR